MSNPETLNLITLREHFKASNVAALVQELTEGPPVCPAIYFKRLEKFLLPYSQLVNALFASPDHFQDFPYNQVPPEMAVPLISTYQECRNAYQSDFKVLHAVLGLCGETLELAMSNTKENYLEEQGDLLFYLTASLRYSGIQVHTLGTKYQPTHRHPYSYVLWRNLASEFTDVVKKIIFYEQPKNGILVDIEEVVKGSARILGGDVPLTSMHYVEKALWELHKILISNIDKLSKRFPNLVFTTEDSHARKDKSDTGSS